MSATEGIEATGEKPRRGFVAGVALLAAASLALEVYLTRVYSLMVWPYMAFIVVSVALLGIGAAGTVLAVLPARRRLNPPPTMAWCAAAFAATAFVGTAAVGHFPANLGPSFLSFKTHAPLISYYLISGLPFFCVGFAFALMFRAYPEMAGRLYFADLAGAGVGALGVVAAMNTLGGPGTLAVITVAAAAGAVSFAGVRPAAGKVALAVAAGAVAVAALFPTTCRVEPSPQKFLPFFIKATGARVERSIWNALGRVDVLGKGDAPPRAPLGAFRGFSPVFRGPFPEVKWITIDGGAETPVVRFGGDVRKTGFLDYYLPSLGYQIKRPREVLIIGAGGGVDVLTALRYGARRVDAVELNPAIVAVGKNYYADFNGGIYNHPAVTCHAAEGRSFVRGTSRRYDLIQLSLVDTFTAAASGAHALSENYLYTLEAFRDFYRHLKPGGFLTVTRNYFLFPHEELRVVALVAEAMRSEGEERASDCIAVIGNGLQANVIAKRGPFTAEELRELARLADGKFEIYWLPGAAAPAACHERIYRNRWGEARLFLSPFAFSPAGKAALDREAKAAGYKLLYASDFLHGYNEFAGLLLAEDRERFFERYFFNVRPPRDDRPFYFLVSKWRNLYVRARTAAPEGFLTGTNFIPTPHLPQILLILTVAESALIAALLLIAPLLLRAKELQELKGKSVFAGYFFLLGFGFMFVEIPVIQKLTLYLGHPVYAFAVVLASLLGASAVGAVASPHVKGPWRLGPFVGAAVTAVVWATLGNKVFAAVLGCPLPAKTLIAVTAVLPVGFFLGMPLPLGIGLVAARARPLVPWVWAANGFASVVGPAIAVFGATVGGHNAVLAAAAVCYAAAGAVFTFAGGFRW